MSKGGSFASFQGANGASMNITDGMVQCSFLLQVCQLPQQCSRETSSCFVTDIGRVWRLLRGEAKLFSQAVATPVECLSDNTLCPPEGMSSDDSTLCVLHRLRCKVRSKFLLLLLHPRP